MSLGQPPFTLPAPHDGREYSIPHVVRRLPIPKQGYGVENPIPLLISLPKVSIQKDWS